MAIPKHLASLLEQFESGAASAAFIPLASALRHERLFTEAIDVCLRGLAGSGDSVAGRTLLGRLYCDTGNYEESAALLRQVVRTAPEAVGARVALARTLLRMHLIEESEALLAEINRQIPLDPDVQILNAAFRYLKPRVGKGASDAGTNTTPIPAETPPTSVEEALDALIEQMKKAGHVRGGLAASWRENREPVIQGEGEALLPFALAVVETASAFEDLELGRVRQGQLEYAHAVILFSCRGDEIILVAMEPNQKEGRFRVLFDQLVERLFPDTSLSETMQPEVK